jgi:dolichol kinase
MTPQRPIFCNAKSVAGALAMAVVAGAALSLVLGVNAAPTRRATASARV